MLGEPDIELTVEAPWPLICAAACRALAEGISMDRLVAQALAGRTQVSNHNINNNKECDA